MAGALSTDRFGKQLDIPREERPSMGRSAVEKLGIIQSAGAIPWAVSMSTRRSRRPSVIARGI